MSDDQAQVESLLAGLEKLDQRLTLPLLTTLLLIARHPGSSVNDIADRLAIPQQTASRYVGFLQGRYQEPTDYKQPKANFPLISLEISADDPRKRAIYLSPAGRRQVSELLSRVFRRGDQ